MSKLDWQDNKTEKPLSLQDNSKIDKTERNKGEAKTVNLGKMLPPTLNNIEDRLWPASELFPYNCGSARRLGTLGTRDPVC